MDAVDALILAMVAIVTHLMAFALGCRSARRQPIEAHAHIYLVWPQAAPAVEEGEEWKLGLPSDDEE